MGTKTAPGRFDCHAAAEPDEPMFVLLARDPSAPKLIQQWAENRAIESSEEELDKVHEARMCAEDMRAWRFANSRLCPHCLGRKHRVLDDGSEGEICSTCHGSGRRLDLTRNYFAGCSSVPDIITVGAARYAVIVDDAAITKAALEMGCVGGKLCGHHNQAELKITLHPNQPPDGARDSLLHELIHALAAQTDVNRDWGDLEEGFVSRLTPALLDVLRRNPRLVQFLTGE